MVGPDDLEGQGNQVSHWAVHGSGVIGQWALPLSSRSGGNKIQPEGAGKHQEEELEWFVV